MDHDRSEGEALGPQEYTAIRMEVVGWSDEAKTALAGKVDGRKVYLVAATLRPETMCVSLRLILYVISAVRLIITRFARFIGTDRPTASWDQRSSMGSSRQMRTPPRSTSARFAPRVIWHSRISHVRVVS